MKTLRNVMYVLFAVLVLCCEACQTSEIPLDYETMEKETYETELETITKLARNGDTDAYYELAVHYRDGNGVEQSNLNALYVQTLYVSMKSATGCEPEVVFGEDHPYYPLAELFKPHYDSGLFEAMFEKMQTVCPLEYKAFETVADYEYIDTSVIIRSLEELEKAGSEMSVLLCAYVYQTNGDTENFVNYLNSRSDKYPMLHILLGQHYEMQYQESNEAYDLEKALEHYGKVDDAAMLTPKNAKKLYQLWMIHGQKGQQYMPDSSELERLERLSTAY